MTIFIYIKLTFINWYLQDNKYFFVNYFSRQTLMLIVLFSSLQYFYSSIFLTLVSFE